MGYHYTPTIIAQHLITSDFMFSSLSDKFSFYSVRNKIVNIYKITSQTTEKFFEFFIQTILFITGQI